MYKNDWCRASWTENNIIGRPNCIMQFHNISVLVNKNTLSPNIVMILPSLTSLKWNITSCEWICNFEGKTLFLKLRLTSRKWLPHQGILKILLLDHFFRSKWWNFVQIPFWACKRRLNHSHIMCWACCIIILFFRARFNCCFYWSVVGLAGYTQCITHGNYFHI